MSENEHREAAINAAVDALYAFWASRGYYDDSTSAEDAAVVIDAALPHLRQQWEEELLGDEAITAAAEAMEDAAIRLLGRDLGTVHRNHITHAGLRAALGDLS